MSKFSAEFEDVWLDSSPSINMSQYEKFLKEMMENHKKVMIQTYILTAVLFIAGMWALYYSHYFMTVLLVALAANFNSQSSKHMFMSHLLSAHRLLAMLINNQHENSAGSSE